MTTTIITRRGAERIRQCRSDLDRYQERLEASGDPELWQRVADAVWDQLLDAEMMAQARARRENEEGPDDASRPSPVSCPRASTFREEEDAQYDSIAECVRTAKDPELPRGGGGRDED